MYTGRYHLDDYGRKRQWESHSKPGRICFDNNIYLFSDDESLSNEHTALG